MTHTHIHTHARTGIRRVARKRNEGPRADSIKEAGAAKAGSA